MKLKAVIFDIDETVADTLPLCITAFQKKYRFWEKNPETKKSSQHLEHHKKELSPRLYLTVRLKA